MDSSGTLIWPTLQKINSSSNISKRQIKLEIFSYPFERTDHLGHSIKQTFYIFLNTKISKSFCILLLFQNFYLYFLNIEILAHLIKNI